MKVVRQNTTAEELRQDRRTQWYKALIALLFGSGRLKKSNNGKRNGVAPDGREGWLRVV